MPAELLTRDAPVGLRKETAQAAQRFNSSQNWIPLALALREVKQQRAYRAWGFRSFSSYVENELDVRKNVASELMSAHEYLSFRHREYLDATGSAAE